jgi:hypothetical protein
MSAIQKISFYLNRRDAVADQELAGELAEKKDRDGIREIAENLWNKNKKIQSDCLKVLYEIGYIDPGLTADYADDFIKLIKNRNNRMVWGAMIALANIAKLKPDTIWAASDDIMKAVEKGTVITVVWGIRTLAGVASMKKEYNRKIFPFLLNRIRNTIPRDVAIHAESVSRAVNDENREEFLSVLEQRKPDLKPSQLSKLKKTIKKVEA